MTTNKTQEVAQELQKGVARDIERVALKAASNRKPVGVSGKKLKKWAQRLRDLAQYLTEEIDLDLLVLANKNTMSVGDMETLRDELDEECNEIQLQLDFAKAKACSNGEYADPGWFARSNYALRCRRSEFNQLNRKIATARKAERAIAQKQRDRLFIDVCRERLPKEDLALVWAEVDVRDTQHDYQ